MGDMHMCYTDIGDNAVYWTTLYRSEPWLVPPNYASLRGYKTSMMAPDLLHVWNLGMLQALLGSALKIVLSAQVVFTHGDLASRFQAASSSLRQFAKQHKFPLRWKKLSKTRLRWKTRSYPELTGSGYDAFVIARWLQFVLEPHSAIYAEILTLLWTSNQAISLLYDAGWFLKPEEKQTVRTLGDVFCRTYISLAAEAIRAGVYLWRVLPKMHLLKHIFRCDRHINIAKYSTWIDEDWLKKIGRTLKLSAQKTSQKRCLQRWLLAIPGNLQSCASKRGLAA